MYDDDIEITYDSETVAIQFNLAHNTIIKWIKYAINKYPEIKDSFKLTLKLKRKVYIIDEAGYSYLCSKYRGMKPASREYEFKNCIIPFLNEMGYEVEYQKTVLTYRVDFYVPALNMVIEYDEEYHNQVKISQYDIKREAEIKAVTGCLFVRIPAKYDTIRALGYISKIVMLKAIMTN